VLIFVDDDMTVESDFISNHLRAHRKWPDALVVGSIRLPTEALTRPFGRFRQRIDESKLPEVPGPTPMRNFCAAGNMSISRKLYEDIGGLDARIVSGEDQDFALRHSALGRPIIFWPRARAIHHDHALDIRAYCQRVEWGSEHLVRFCRRHPGWPDNVERERVNSPLRWGGEPVSLSLRKLIKSTLALPALRQSLFLVTSLLERTAPNGRVLDRMYRLLLGVHIRRGYRKGAQHCDQ
jgi:GT2 family glycosyltransferase